MVFRKGHHDVKCWVSWESWGTIVFTKDWYNNNPVCEINAT
jgi:hypothetical protein